MCTFTNPIPPAVLLHNSLCKDQQQLWTSLQGEFWQCDGIHAEETAETGGAAAEEDENAESKQQQEEGQEGDIRNCNSIIYLNWQFEKSVIISFMFDALNDESKLNVHIDEE